MHRVIQKAQRWLIKNIVFNMSSFFWKTSTIEYHWPKQCPSCESWEDLNQRIKSPLIVAFWHNELLLATHLFSLECSFPLSAVISKSRDGMLLNSIIKQFGHMNVVEVAHDNRSGALREIISQLKQGQVVLITPDGPRGPWKKAKVGVGFAAKKSKATVLALSITIDKYWKLPTKDGILLPKPRAKIKVELKLVDAKKDSDCKAIAQTVEDSLGN